MMSGNSVSWGNLVDSYDGRANEFLKNKTSEQGDIPFYQEWNYCKLRT